MRAAPDRPLLVLAEIVRGQVGWHIDLSTVCLGPEMLGVEDVLEVLVSIERPICEQTLRAGVGLIADTVLPAVVFRHRSHLLLGRGLLFIDQRNVRWPRSPLLASLVEVYPHL